MEKELVANEAKTTSSVCGFALSFYMRPVLAGTNPSKVAARLSLAELLLVVLLGTGNSVSSSTDATTAATVALVRVLSSETWWHARYSESIGRQFVDGYFNIFSVLLNF
jgi:hypothetical protein